MDAVTKAVLMLKFLSKVDRKGDDECWPATATPSQKYPQLVIPGGNKPESMHRIAFYLRYNYWPVIGRHSCDYTKCANWSHILDGTQRDNVQDSIMRGRFSGNGFKYWTHCKNGHEFTTANTYIRPDTGQRSCRKCKRDWLRTAREEGRI